MTYRTHTPSIDRFTTLAYTEYFAQATTYIHQSSETQFRTNRLTQEIVIKARVYQHILIPV